MEPILVDAVDAAKLLSISERQFHNLRKKENWPLDIAVLIGPRFVRYRVDVLKRYAAELANGPRERKEPIQLERARKARSRVA